MSALLSTIGVPDREVSANITRIKNTIGNILKSNPKFKDFDIVSYGSSAQKLFIKGYSDFDFCIRCKDLQLSHEEAMSFIGNQLQLAEEKQDKHGFAVEEVEIIKSA